MATAALGIFNRAETAGRALTGTAANPEAGSAAKSDSTTNSNNTGSASSSSAAISANDFLTLLVTEMQNQDPTATTDPNEYINQLVSVNSLEQLIDINQNLTTALGNSSATTNGAASAQAKPAATVQTTATGNAQATDSVPDVTSAARRLALPSSSGRVPGNLSVPATNPAATRVAQSLNGRSRAQSSTAGLSGAL